MAGPKWLNTRAVCNLKRDQSALAFLRLRPQASALEIGSIAVRGETWARDRASWKSKEAIGLSIAVRFVEQGRVRVDGVFQ